jgi:hypothetical protein
MCIRDWCSSQRHRGMKVTVTITALERNDEG